LKNNILKVGCGTYADNTLGGISATGTGEVIMKSVLVYDVLLRAKYKGESLDVAAQTACDEMLDRYNASGGVIALGTNGDVGIGFSSNQMAWAYQKGQKVFYGVDRNQRLEIDLN
jgi:beta-aspartyl-peptidase (threonine type)